MRAYRNFDERHRQNRIRATEGQAALLRKSSIPALLDIARKKDKDLELLFAILWSINAPPSLRALPRITRNLHRSLLILQLRYEIDLAAAGLGEWLEMLKWIASDPDVNQLCFKQSIAKVVFHHTHSQLIRLGKLSSGVPFVSSVGAKIQRLPSGVEVRAHDGSPIVKLVFSTAAEDPPAKSLYGPGSTLQRFSVFHTSSSFCGTLNVRMRRSPARR